MVMKCSFLFDSLHHTFVLVAFVITVLFPLQTTCYVTADAVEKVIHCQEKSKKKNKKKGMSLT